MIKIAICDENFQDRKNLKGYIEDFNQQYDIPCIVYEYESGESLLREIASQPYHIVFLDICMKQLSGVELAKQIRVCNRQATLVFVTSTPDYALVGYTVHAYDYLLKPLDKLTFRDTLEDIYKHLETHLTNDNIYIFPTTQGTLKLNLNQILYIESNNRKTMIHVEGGIYTCHYSINVLEEKLAFEGFIRTHRSFIVNHKKVQEVKASEVILEDGTSVFMSKYKQKIVKEKLTKALEVRQ